MCFLSETVPWHFEKIHSKSILHLMHLANPTQIFFPNKFHSTTVNEKIISLSIQTNRNDGWPRNKNALMPRFQLRWLYLFLGPIQKYGLILGFQLSWIYWCAGEQIRECVQCSVPFTHLCRACFPPAVWYISHNSVPSCTTAHGAVVRLCTANNIIDKAMLPKYNNELL